MFIENLLQNSPFRGQGIDPDTGKVVDITDFIGCFEVLEECYDEESTKYVTNQWSTINVSRLNDTTRVFTDNGNITVSLSEYSEVECGIGAGCWLSSIAMMSWIKDNMDMFKDKMILEIGSGVALPSLYLGKNMNNQNKFNLHCSDYKETIGYVLKENQKNNDININDLQYSVLDWKECLKAEYDPFDTIGKFDIIIACDCIYKSTANIFKEAVLKHLKSNGKIIFINPLETSRPGVDQFIYSLAEQGEIDVKHIAVRHNNKYVKPLHFVVFSA
jgi:SAM-dependent methyltransferase